MEMGIHISKTQSTYKYFMLKICIVMSLLKFSQQFFSERCINYSCNSNTAAQNGYCINNDSTTGSLVISKCPKGTFCNAITFASSNSFSKDSSFQKCIRFEDFFDARLQSQNPDGSKTGFIPVNYYCSQNSDCISNSCINSYCVGIPAGSACKNPDNNIPACELNYYCSSSNICVSKKANGADCKKDYECSNTAGCFNSICTEYYSLPANAVFSSINIDQCLGYDCGPYSYCINKKCVQALDIGNNCISGNGSCPFFAKCNSNNVCEKSFDPANSLFPNVFCESNFATLNSSGSYSCADVKVSNKPTTGAKTCSVTDTTNSCGYNYNMNGFNLQYFFTCGCDTKTANYVCQDGTNDDSATLQITKNRNSMIKRILSLCPRNYPFCQSIINIDLYQKDVYKYINSGITPIYSDSTSDLGIQMIIGNLIVYEVCEYKPEQITGSTSSSTSSATTIKANTPITVTPTIPSTVNTITSYTTSTVDVNNIGKINNFSSSTINAVDQSLLALVNKYSTNPNLIQDEGKKLELQNILNNMNDFISRIKIKFFLLKNLLISSIL